MSLTHQQLEKRIASIRSHCNPNSGRYGRLLNWRGDFVWHYGIGLSDTHFFDTGDNLQVFRANSTAKLVIGVDGRLFDPDQVVERLICALHAFPKWDYGVLGWNCEHLARLVATDDPISHEVRKAPWPVPSLNNDGRHPTALQEFHDYLQAHAPDLLIRGQRRRGSKRSEPEAEAVLDERDFARILGLRDRVTVSDIKRAYRQRMMEHHPDRVAALGPKLRELAEKEAKKINAAYEFFMARVHQEPDNI